MKTSRFCIICLTRYFQTIKMCVFLRCVVQYALCKPQTIFYHTENIKNASMTGLKWISELIMLQYYS